jgi:hypothetical protein
VGGETTRALRFVGRLFRTFETSSEEDWARWLSVGVLGLHNDAVMPVVIGMGPGLS